jgi:uncharacterized protein
LTVFGQFYYPAKVDYGTPANFGLKYESVSFESRDGTKLSGWFVASVGKPVGTVIHFHGNAQNMSAHFSYVAWLPAYGFNVFAFDYRGYGTSGGTPTRVGVHEDAIAALQHIKTRKGVDQDSLLVFGQSLGGAIAITAVGSTNIVGLRGVAVESTFDSYTAIAKEKAPSILARLFIADDLSPISVVTNLAPIPALFIHGTADEVVPYSRGKSLFDRAREPKTMWRIHGGRHTEAFTRYGSIYRPRLVAFFQNCMKRKSDSNKAP